MLFALDTLLPCGNSVTIKTKLMKNNIMKLKKVFPIAAILLVGSLGSCKKETTGLDPGKTSGTTPLQVTQAVVNLGTAGNFAIMSQSGITDVYKSAVTGDVGSSPVTGAAILLTCAEVTGTIYSVDAAGPLPCRVTDAGRLTTSVGDMQAAYTDAAGRSNPDFLNLGAGDIGGKTLTAGLYKWSSAVTIPGDITISGNSTDVWIFQIAGTLNMGSAVKVILQGGAQAKNIFWQVADGVTLGTTSHCEGIILGKTGINLQTGASVTGRLLAQTAVTLQMNTITQP
jgi:Ice-binding-like